jgi:biotin carboxylase
VVGTDYASPIAGDGRQLALSFTDIANSLVVIEQYAGRFPLDSIIAVDDAGTRLAAHASRRLELPHNPVAAVEATRDKSLLRSTIARSGLPSPPYRVIHRSEDIAAVAASLDYPVVLKPLSLSASRGVIRANDAGEFVDAFRRVEAILNDPAVAADCEGFADRILVEGYVPGYEVSLEGLLRNGRLDVLAIFDKPDPLEGPFFEETIYVTPSRHSPGDIARVIAVTERALASLGLQDGPVHAELRVNDRGAFPIDIAARSIGGLCSRTLSFGAGMSLEELLLRHAVRLPVESYDRESRAAGVMMIPTPRSGALRSIHGVAEAERIAGIESVTISIPIGQRVTTLPEGDEYLGFIFARGAGPASVEAALREAHRLLEFEIV